MSPKNFDTVPDSDTEVATEVGYHRRTKRGMKSTYKQKTIAQEPPEVKPAKASRSRSKTKMPTRLPEEGTSLQDQEPAHVEYMQAHEFIDDGQEYDSQLLGGDAAQPRTMV
jgi:hypothetical protein